MGKISSKLLQITPGALAALSVSAGGAIAADKPVDEPVADTTAQIESIESADSEANSAIDQVTSVSQLSDVRPTDWAFQALQNLVERYRCIAGYPDGTFRGNRAMTRYEFAAGLNACLEAITQLIGSPDTSRLATREDLAVLQRLMEEFALELATLRGRVDSIEARTAELEANQFSTTTKLNGEIIFAAADSFGEDTNTSTFFGHRTRLNFDTSFTGEDILRTRLQIVGLDAFSANSHPAPEGDLRFAAGAYDEGTNEVSLDALLYAFPIGEKTTVIIEANAGAADDFTNTVNPYIDGDGSNGALSNFATRNSIYYLISNAGIGVRHEFSERLELSLGYLATNAPNPTPGNGFFNGPFGALAQVTFKPSDRFTVGLTYLNSYNNDMLTGSNRANLRTVLDNEAGLDLPTSSNSYGIEASLQLSKRFIIGGWVGYTNTQVLSTLGGQIDRGDMDIWNAAVTLTLPDLGKEGNVAALIVGVEPMVRKSSVTAAVPGLPDVFGADKDTSLHVEAFYQYKLTDNIAITPGVIWLTAPDHNNDNNDIVIGALRTTFSF